MIIDPERIRSFLQRRHRRVMTGDALMHAAVLILLFHRDGETWVLLTKRTSDVEHHKGQISFPGGAVDAADENLVATALRETEEEIGFPSSAIDVLGLFDDAWVPSGFRITPVLGFANVLPEARLNTREVERIVEVPVAFFLDPENERVQVFHRDGKPMDVYFYTFGNNEIWGATAAMLRAFLHEVRGELENEPGKKPL